MRKSFIFRNLAKMLLGQDQFNTEDAYRAKDAVISGLEIEDPTDSYTDDDRLTSAVGTLEEHFESIADEDQDAQELAYRVLNQG